MSRWPCTGEVWGGTICLCSCDARRRRQRGRARGEMQEFAAGKFHFEPPFTSFDHLVGARLQCQRHSEAQRLRGPEIDDQLKFRRLHYRQVGRFFAFEYPAAVNAGLTTCIGYTCSVAHQATGRGKLAHRIDRRQRVAGSQCDELFAPIFKKRIDVDKQRRGPLVDERGEGWLEVDFGAGFDNNEFLPQRGRRCLHISCVGFHVRIGRIHEQADLCRRGHQLVQQFEQLRRQQVAQQVTLPPGRLRLATRPNLTGSLPITKTIGIVVLVALTASAGAVATAAIAATRRSTRSDASTGSWSYRPSATRPPRTLRKAQPRRSTITLSDTPFTGHFRWVEVEPAAVLARP